MNIMMKDTASGSIDGINTAIYEAGQEYDLTANAGERELAEAFVGAGLAEEVGTEAPVADAEAAEANAPVAAEAAAPARPARSRGKQ